MQGSNPKRTKSEATSNWLPQGHDWVAGILVGGESRRMGIPKATLHFRGKPLVQHVAEVAVKIAGEVVLLGDADLNVTGVCDLTRVGDAPFGKGPLRGLHSLLTYAASRWAMLLACDMPLVSASLLHRLVDSASEKVDAVAFARRHQPGVFHACCAAYHPRALDAVTAELSHGVGKMQNIFKRIPCLALTTSEDEDRSLMNVNTREELAQAVQQVT